MATKKLFDYGERLELGIILANIGTLTLKLFTAPTDLLDDMAAGDFTEASFPDYAPVTLTGGALAAGNPGGAALLTWDDVLFTRGSGVGSEDVYGYIVEDSTATPVWGEIFVDGGGTPTPKTMAIAGDTITISPKFYLKSRY